MDIQKKSNNLQISSIVKLIVKIIGISHNWRMCMIKNLQSSNSKTVWKEICRKPLMQTFDRHIQNSTNLATCKPVCLGWIEIYMALCIKQDSR